MQTRIKHRSAWAVPEFSPLSPFQREAHCQEPDRNDCHNIYLRLPVNCQRSKFNTHQLLYVQHFYCRILMWNQQAREVRFLSSRRLVLTGDLKAPPNTNMLRNAVDAGFGVNESSFPTDLHPHSQCEFIRLQQEPNFARQT